MWPGFKPGGGRQTFSRRFDSYCFPPVTFPLTPLPNVALIALSRRWVVATLPQIHTAIVAIKSRRFRLIGSAHEINECTQLSGHVLAMRIVEMKSVIQRPVLTQYLSQHALG